MLRHLLLLGCLLSTGCSMLPEISRQPALHNPFPQLSKVAVAPFFNLSQEATVDGRQVALAYFNELQLVPGYEVVPVGVVETAMRTHNIQLGGPADARRLAQVLEVDAVVVGAVTDFTPYYPPRCGLQVEWYAANPCFHPIPPGYGLPWGTPDEKRIPAPLVFEAEMALAKAQLKTQTPSDQLLPVPQSQSPEVPAVGSRRATAGRSRPPGGRRSADFGPRGTGPADNGRGDTGRGDAGWRLARSSLPRDATRLARPARVHPAAPPLSPADLLAERGPGDASHADLQRARHGVYRGAGQLLLVP